MHFSFRLSAFGISLVCGKYNLSNTFEFIMELRMKISRPHTKRKCNSLKRKSENSDSLGYYFKKAGIGTAVSLLGSFALLIFFSALSMLSKDPAIFVFPFSSLLNSSFKKCSERFVSLIIPIFSANLT